MPNEKPPNAKPPPSAGPEWADIDCPICRGAGFVHVLNDTGKPDFAQAEPCPTCYYQQSDDYLRKHGMNPLQTFTRFKKTPQNQEALAAAKSFADGTTQFLLIFGLPGCGKTHLCSGVVLRLFADRKRCRMLTVSELLTQAKQRIADNSVDSFFDGVKNCRCLVLDDWKAESQTPWAVERLEDIVDYRYKKCQMGDNLPLMVTTNLVLTDIPPRVVSRFSDQQIGGRVVRNTAADYRRQKGPQP